MMTFEIEEEQRQAMLLALAELSLRRPGWHWMLGELAEKPHSRDMFEAFRKTSSDAIGPLPPGSPLLTDDEREEVEKWYRGFKFWYAGNGGPEFEPTPETVALLKKLGLSRLEH